MWIYTKAVLYDDQEPTQEYLRRRLLSIMESVSWVCEEATEGHEWVSELITISLQENKILVALNYEIDVPCVVQWGLLWFSSPSRLNERFADNGTIFAMYRDVKDLAIVATFIAPFGGLNTPRTCMLRSVAAVLARAQDKDWDVGKEMVGWGLGGSGLCFCLVKTTVAMSQMNEGAGNP